jgi:spore coat protein U-like protein
MKKQLLAIGVCAALGLASNASFASGNISGNVPLSLTISDACSISTGGINGSMGSHSAGIIINSGNNISIGDLEITCATGVSYSWGVNGGSYMTAPGGTARMRKGGTSSYIAYSIETSATPDAAKVGDSGLVLIDPAYTETNTGNTAVTGTGTGLPQPTALYLNPVSEETAPSGTYTDTIKFTVAWP